MAKKTPRPGRTLLIFGLSILVLYGLAALGQTWKPRLGLDLEVGGHAAQPGVERGPQPLPRRLSPELAQVGRRMPSLRHVSARGNPRGNGQQRHVPLPGLVRREPQRLQAPWRPMHANNDPTHRGHGTRLPTTGRHGLERRP